METRSIDPALIQGIIHALYRLFRVGTFHSIDNEAVDISLRSTLDALRRLDDFESEGITLIFAEDTAIVNGQLLRATPDIYESAMDFAKFLERLGVNALTIKKDVSESGLRKLLALFIDKENPAGHLDERGHLSPAIRLRLINPSLLLGLEDERLSQLERVLLTYAFSVLVIRRMFDTSNGGTPRLAGYFKRMARQLAMVNYADRPVVLDVMVARHLEADVAKLAVNSGIIAVAMARRFTKHEGTLSRICMAALLLDVGRYRATRAGNETPLALSNAISHMAMGQLRGDAIERTIIAYEAQALLDGTPADQVYSDGTPVTVESTIVATARRFVELVSLGVDGAAIDTDEAIVRLHADASSHLGHYAIDLLTDAIGLIPRGSCVELDSGYRAVVLRSGPSPTRYEYPTVVLVEDPRGNRLEPQAVALNGDDEAARQHGPVMRVINRPSPVLRAAQTKVAGPLYEWIRNRKASEEQVAAQVRTDVAHLDGARSERDAQISGFHRIPTGAGTDARKRALASHSGSFDAAEVATRTVERSAAAAEFERRTSQQASGGDFADVGTGLKRTAPPSQRRHASSGATSVRSGAYRMPGSTSQSSAHPVAAPSHSESGSHGASPPAPPVQERTRSSSDNLSAVDDAGFTRSPSAVSRKRRTLGSDQRASGIHRQVRRSASTGAPAVVESATEDWGRSEEPAARRAPADLAPPSDGPLTGADFLLRQASGSAPAVGDADADRPSDALGAPAPSAASPARAGSAPSTAPPAQPREVETPMAGTGILRRRTGARPKVPTGSQPSARVQGTTRPVTGSRTSVPARADTIDADELPSTPPLGSTAGESAAAHPPTPQRTPPSPRSNSGARTALSADEHRPPGLPVDDE